jgi:hypothetical protein
VVGAEGGGGGGARHADKARRHRVGVEEGGEHAVDDEAGVALEAVQEECKGEQGARRQMHHVPSRDTGSSGAVRLPFCSTRM